jgi:hypothetical protein
VASGVVDWVDDVPDRFDVPDRLERFDVLEWLDLDPVALLPVVGVDAWACEASWATRLATPAAATVTRPAVAAASRRVPSWRADRVDVMH